MNTGTDSLTPPETAPTPAPTPAPDQPIRPFENTGEVVRAFKHPKFDGQFIIADAASSVLCVCPSEAKARLVYEAVNGYFQALALREAMMAEQKANAEKRIITPHFRD